MDASSFDMPRPDRVSTPAEFIAAMRALRDRAQLTYRQLERRAQAAGDRLPRSTIAAVLSRDRIPRESTIASFVRACGGDRHAVELWLAARRRVSATDETVDNLAEAVEAWLTKRARSGPKDKPRGYAAEAPDTPASPADLAKLAARDLIARDLAAHGLPANLAGHAGHASHAAHSGRTGHPGHSSRSGHSGHVVPAGQLTHGPVAHDSGPQEMVAHDLTANDLTAHDTAVHDPAHPAHPVHPAHPGAAPGDLTGLGLADEPTTGEFAAARVYSEGRLASAVAQAKGERWVGVHRRTRANSSGSPSRWRTLVRKLRAPRLDDEATPSPAPAPAHSEITFPRPATNP